MVKIKGLIIFEKLSFKRKLKSFLGIYETELREYGGKKLFILKTDKYNDTVRKRFIRRRITKLAVSPETDENIKRLENEGFDLVVKADIIKKNIAETVKKYALSSGVEKGKLTLGIAVSEPAEYLEKLKKIGDYISEIYLYGKKSGKSYKAADSFYNKTGISVILCESGEIRDCNIVILEKKAEHLVKNFGGAMYYTDKTGCIGKGKLIKDMRLFIPKELKDINADDVILAGLFEFEFKIAGFVTEKQKMLDKK